MFRSWGELQACATDVFHLFAEASDATASASSTPSPPLHTPQNGLCNEPELRLSKAGMECAYYVLFGRYPTPSLVDDCFSLESGWPPTRVPPGTAASSTFDGARDSTAQHATRTSVFNVRPRGSATHHITLSEYLRFMTVCAEEEGPSCVLQPRLSHQDQADVSTSDDLSPLLHIDASKATQLQYWQLFESVAGAKGFITFDDLCAIDAEHPFQAVESVLRVAAPPRSSGAAAHHQEPIEAATRRKQALTRHIFWILDRDRDGKVRFDDVKPFLVNST